ncbi:phage tail-collar fiber domain-containing protein [Proteus mirabilis]|uniref:phage tail-collar fiber domain-containing protein n=1 Tax=Proteus mirabilis TaxID=584 RepID=UPI000B4A1A76|nr:phage tail protein [Proteus mirabilis]ASB01971.1 phage tail protein [Proteus mirabilis]MCT8211903.1 phage tail protein [Proteus mirabilis]MDF7378586.1 phage tail protein [Proteus mirabilis]MDL2096330.1 phage tail protein [Proteus mirabilis]HAU5008412.1 phage tail protein [Proteus mirabilis]
MSAKFFALLTVIGANKLAKATALGTTLKITQMAVGDGGGTLPTPDTQQTKLVGEKRRAGLNTLFVDPKNDSQIIAEQVIPENEGGYWIREIGLFDDEGSLIAVGNCPETYKPQLQEGSGRTQTIRMILTVSHTESVELKVDPSVILATREFVNDAIESASKQTLEEVAKLYATKAELSTGLSKVQKSADAANTNANSRVPSTRKVNNKPLNTDITLTAGDVGAATPAQVNEAKTAASNAQATANSGVSKADAAQKTANDAVSKANAAQTAANNANTNANGRVPSTRKINNKPLSADISLTAGDVGAATPAQVNEAKTAASNAQATANSGVSKADAAQKTANDAVSKANAAQTAANNANTNANGRVPNTRKVNGKPLSADISLTAGDVGAATPAQVNEAKTVANNANNNANGRVPNTRKVNGKPLSGDISLNASDVGALTQAQGDARYQKKGTGQNFRKIWSGNAWSKGGTITVSEDVRGKTIYIKGNSNGYLGGGIQVPNQINVGIVINWYKEFHLFSVTSSDGKTLRCGDTSWGIIEVWVQD